MALLNRVATRDTRMTQTIERAGLTFLCDDPIEVWRAETILEKEPGTIRWLDRIQPGDVFYDVGANIGVYSLYAAKRGAKVYAFEPHALNALHLARNATMNGLDITVVQAVIGAYDGWTDGVWSHVSRADGGAFVEVTVWVSDALARMEAKRAGENDIGRGRA